jgi:Xaa-Pro dipeptidase
MTPERLQRAQQGLQTQQIDWLALVPGPNLLYLTGIHAHLSERPLVYFLPAEGEPAIIIPLLEASKAEAVGIPPHRIFAWRDETGYGEAFAQAQAALGWAGKRVAVEKLYLRVLELEALQLVPFSLTHADPLLNGLRRQKDPSELAAMRRAVQVAEEAFLRLVPQIKIGQTEKQIAALLNQEMLNGGADGLAFPTIVAGGPNAALPHAVPTDRPIAAGDLLIIDWGAIVNDYPSDLTRTLAVGAEAAQWRPLYEVVRAANEAGKGVVAPGVACRVVDGAARQVIAAAGYGEYFIHRTGHGLGLEVHEAPSLMAGNEEPLVAGMVFTVEPGVYLPGQVGVRIEDDVLVTAVGHDSLTTLSRAWQEVG